MDWAWHVHHEVLIEPLTEPIENRIAYIKSYKPKGEVALRLKLLRMATGLPDDPAYDKARAAFDKAEAAFDKAEAAYDKARAAYLVKHSDAFAQLHAQQCEPDCPWNGKTIFPKEK